MLPETMVVMESIARHRAGMGERKDDYRWETWPSSRLDRFALYVWRAVTRLFSRD